MRLVNALIAGSAVLLGAFLSSHHLSFSVYLSGLSVALITAGGNLINDYFDVEVDRINNPERLIPSGKMTRRQVLITSIILFFIGNGLFAFIDIYLFLIGIFATILLTLYTPFLKVHPLVGNIAISGLVALTFLVGGIASFGNLKDLGFPALFAFLLNLPREILKDGEDLVGDRKAGMRTFPIVFGIRKTCYLVITLLWFLVSAILIAFFHYGNFFRICAGFGVAVPIIIMIKRSTSSPFWFRNTQRILKMLIIPGILALLLSEIK